MNLLRSLLVPLALAGCQSLDLQGYSHAAVKSRYTAPAGFTVERDPVLQGEADLTFSKEGKPLFLVGTWQNYNLTEGQLSEVDWYLSATRQLGPFQATAVLNHYEFTGPLEGVPDANEFDPSITWETALLTLSLAARFADYQTGTGAYYQGAVSRKLPITDRLALTPSLSVGAMDDYFFDFEGLYHVSLDTALQWQFSDRAFLRGEWKERHVLDDLFSNDRSFAVVLGTTFGGPEQQAQEEQP